MNPVGAAEAGEPGEDGEAAGADGCTDGRSHDGVNDGLRSTAEAGGTGEADVGGGVDEPEADKDEDDEGVAGEKGARSLTPGPAAPSLARLA